MVNANGSGDMEKPPLRWLFHRLRCAVDCVYYIHNTDHRSAIAAIPLEVDGTRGVNIHYQATGESELSLL